MIKLVYTIGSSIKNGYRLLKSSMIQKDIRETKTANPFGFDSFPVENYIGIYAETSNNADPVIIGYLNREAMADLKAGESAQYSTDGSGKLVVSLIIRNDGTVEIIGNDDNAVRFSELKVAFDTLKSEFDALVNIFNAHVHSGVTTGPGSSGPTATPGTTSAASIDAAKVDSIKIPKKD